MDTSEKTHRPCSVTLLVCVISLFAAWYLVRLGGALARWEYLCELQEPISPAYQALTGLIWGGVWLALALGLFFGKSWARRNFWKAAGAFSLYFWTDRLLLIGPVERNANWLFVLGIHLVLVFLFVWIFSREKAKLFFAERVQAEGVQNERSGN